MESTLSSTSADDLREGACTDAENTVEKIKAAIGQSLRMGFFLWLIVVDSSLNCNFVENKKAISTARRFRLKTQGCFNPGEPNAYVHQPGTGCDSGRNRVAVESPLNPFPRVAAAATLGSGTQPLRGKLNCF
jgi:hypothetical protein